MKNIKNTTYTHIFPEDKENIEQFIRGSVLGDGHLELSSKNSKNARIKFGHCEKQLDYIMWKQEFLKKYDLITERKIYKYRHNSDRYKNGFCETYTISSKTHPIFTEYLNKYYKNKKRVLDREDLIKMNEFALAIWFMDDGYIWNRNNKSSKIVFATCSFSSEDVLFLIELLKNKWDIKSTYYKTSNEIIISVYDCEKLINIVKPYIQKCLLYKTKLVHVKQGELLENPEEDNQQPSLGSNTLEGSTTNSQILPSNVGDSNADTSALQQTVNIKSRGLTIYPGGIVSGGLKSVDDIV